MQEADEAVSIPAPIVVELHRAGLFDLAPLFGPIAERDRDSLFGDRDLLEVWDTDQERRINHKRLTHNSSFQLS